MQLSSPGAVSRLQGALDAQEPPDYYAEPDDLLDEFTAAEVAQGEFDRTPMAIAEWLHEECHGETDVLDERAFSDRIGTECTPAMLLVNLMTCDKESMQSWVYALREKFSLYCDAHGDTKRRANELLADQEREQAALESSARADAWERSHEH